MNHSDFKIGIEFTCGGKLWRCTDVGSRVVVAICLSDHEDDPSWFNGPPYAVVETVFDEHDLPACKPMTDTEREAAIAAGPDAVTLTDEQLAGFKRIPRATFIRRKLGLSREQFAERFRIPLDTLRDWERHRAEPEAAMLAYLLVIEREPEAVGRALAPEAA